MTHVVIVSSDFYPSEDLANALKAHGVTASCVYRDYNFDPSLYGVDVVVSDGTCKTRGESDLFGDDPYAIFYHEPEDAAKSKHVPFVRIFRAYAGFTPKWIIKWRVRRVLAAIKK